MTPTGVSVGVQASQGVGNTTRATQNFPPSGRDTMGLWCDLVLDGRGARSIA